jgi:hypothetical protein
LDSRDNLVDIITDNAKADVFGVLFDNTSKGSLGLLRHHVGLIQNDEFISLGKQCSRFGELLDLLPDNIYATFIGCIELQKTVNFASLRLVDWQGLTSRICLRYSAPYIRRATARIVDVFPVPGGP